MGITVDTYERRGALRFKIQGVPYGDNEKLRNYVKGTSWDPDVLAHTCPAAIWFLNDLVWLYPDLQLIYGAKAWYEGIREYGEHLLHVKHLPDIEEWKEKWHWAYPHQRVSAKFHLEAGRSFDWSDPGTGKTLALMIATIESGALKNCGCVLVVAPNSAKLNWRDEIRGAQERVGLNHPIWVFNGGLQKKMLTIHDWVKHGGWLITNWESLRFMVDIHKDKNDQGKTVRKYAKGSVLLSCLTMFDKKIEYLISDEAHAAKNREAEQTMALTYLSEHVSRTTEATATPITVGPEDLYSPLHRGYPDQFNSFWFYAERYCKIEEDVVYIKGKERAVKKIIGANLERSEELSSITGLIAVRHRFEDVAKDVPAKQYKVLPVELTSEQTKLYEKAVYEWFKVLQTMDGNQLIPIPNVISQLTYLRQICLDPVMVGAPCRTTPAKTGILLDRINELGGEPLVVMTKFVKYINRLEVALKRENISYMRITGEEDPAERHANVQAFQAGKVHVALCGIDAGGVSLTLTNSCKMDFTDRDWTKARNDQAEGRIRRQGQKHAQLYSIYVADGTVDARIEASIAFKGQVEESFVNQPTRIRVEDLRWLLKG